VFRPGIVSQTERWRRVLPFESENFSGMRKSLPGAK
jgi:hypothetical protein